MSSVEPMAAGSSSLALKKAIAGIPVMGPLARQSYRILTGAHGRSGRGRHGGFGAVLYNRVEAEVSALHGSLLFDGHASISSPEVAARLDTALHSAAEEVPLIVFPVDRGNALHIGLREDDVPAFTQALEASLGARLRWRQARDFLDPENPLAAFPKPLRRYHRLDMDLAWPAGLRTQITATLYFSGEEKIDSRDNRNRYLRHIHRSNEKALAAPGLRLCDSLLDGHPAEAGRTPVDVVYTWVNNDDPAWKALYAKAKGRKLEEDHEKDARSAARFTNRDELRYSIRSVEQYLPWVRKIFVFTNCAPPAWYQPSQRLVWVRHEDVIPELFLPTFNSHAIESFLHLLPGISENFLYFNDDFFVNEPVPRSFFFTPNDLCIANLEDYGAVNGEVRAQDKDYLNAARNGIGLIRERFGIVPTRLHKHAPYAMKVSVLRALERDFPGPLQRTRKAKFRTARDVSVASFLFHHYAFATGAGIENGYRTKMVKNTSEDIASDLRPLREGKGIRTFCLNDGGNSHNDEEWDREIREFLAARYPVPTSYERLD